MRPRQPSRRRRPRSGRTSSSSSPTTGRFPRGRLRRSHGQHAELRSCRPRGRAVHPGVHGGAIVHAVARGALDGAGSAPPRGSGNLHGFPPKRCGSLPISLEEAATSSGSRKRLGSRALRARRAFRNPAGPVFKSFDEFLQQRAGDRPFCYLFGSTDPHRPVRPGFRRRERSSSRRRLQIPAFLPDTSEVRNDLLDYYFRGPAIRSADRADSRDARTIRRSRADGDCGHVGQRHAVPARHMNVCDAGARVLLAIRGPGVARAGRAIESFVRSSRSGAHLARSRGIDAASRDDRTHAGPAPAW